MRITARILIPNLLSLGLVVLVLLYLITELGRERDLLQRQVSSVEQANRLSSQLDQLQRQISLDLLSYRYDQDPRHLSAVKELDRQISEAVNAFGYVMTTPRGNELLQDYVRSRMALQVIQQDLVSAIEARDEKAMAQTYQRWALSNRLVRAQLNDLFTYKTLALKRLLNEVEHRHDSTITVVVVLTLFSFAAIFLSSLYYGKTVARPIQRVTDVAQRIARGEVALRIRLPRRSDEVTDLAEAFNRMADQLVSANAELEAKVHERTAELAHTNVSLRHEIAERLKVEAALVQSERLAAVGQMITGLSHESRNALQRSLACLDMLERRVSDEKLRFFLFEARDAQAELQRVYEGVRNYAGPITLERVPQGLDQIWRRTWDQMRMLWGEREVSFTERLDGVDLRCQVDSFRMNQVFRNLFENSLAACEDPVQIEIECSEIRMDEEATIRVVVRDNGPGLDSDQEARLFEPFYTTKTKGTGLGMSIVKRIMEAHGGRVAVVSGEGQGLAVELLIPRGIEA